MKTGKSLRSLRRSYWTSTLSLTKSEARPPESSPIARIQCSLPAKSKEWELTWRLYANLIAWSQPCSSCKQVIDPSMWEKAAHKSWQCFSTTWRLKKHWLSVTKSWEALRTKCEGWQRKTSVCSKAPTKIASMRLNNQVSTLVTSYCGSWVCSWRARSSQVVTSMTHNSKHTRSTSLISWPMTKHLLCC